MDVIDLDSHKERLRQLHPLTVARITDSVRLLQKHGLGAISADDMLQILSELPSACQAAPKLLWRDNQLVREKSPKDVPEEQPALTRTISPSKRRFSVKAGDFHMLTRTKDAADMLLGACLEITSQGTANIGDLIESLVQGASKLLNADRCSFFRVEGQNLVCSVAGGEGPMTIRVPVGSGLVGFVAENGELLNIPDAYADSRFNQDVDRQTGYVTTSLLCGPVVFRGQVIAVVQLINKVKNAAHVPFTSEDEELFRGFAGFAGVALSNAYLYYDSLAERRKNEVLIESVRTLSSADVRNAEELSLAIRGGVTELLGAELCTFFAFDKETNCLVARTEKGQLISTSIGQGIAGRVCQTRESVNIVDPYAHPLFNPDIDEKVGLVTRDILCIPIVTQQGDVMGVVQVLNKHESGGFTKADEDLLEFFAHFAALQLSNARMCEEMHESKEKALRLLSFDTELGSTSEHRSSRSGIAPASDVAVSIAMALPVTSDEKGVVLSSEFNIHSYSFESGNCDRLIPLGVSLMQQPGYLERYGIADTKMCKFLLTVSAKYRPVPYHNFLHAFDVAQTIFVFLTKGSVQSAFSELDAFVLLISAFLHDIDHMGLNNSFHTKTETPLGFLSAESGASSVLEVHHCNLSLEILGMEPTGLFDDMSKTDSTYAYKSLLGNILATDMAKHGELLKAFVSTCEAGYDRDNADHRRLATKMLMKSADLSNLTKPFNIARLWAIAVTDEFFQQGDTERSSGYEVTPMFNRDSNNELASGQIGFIDYVALPFYEALAPNFPGLSFALEQLRLNRNRWSQVSKARRSIQENLPSKVLG